MPRHVPDEFRSDEEMTEWFENADLSEDLLERVADVEIASHVTLTIEDDLGAGQAPDTANATSGTKLTLAR